ncbi:MAG: hypothetical protein C0154_01395 [Mucilaginibacter sp.]|nr:MAG: hypothetical protein BGO48_11155 [Mucilaginibacter sp. 44-25]PLW91412.1 MAG: hypothetical protein C0154_01395 [Mucilaginibacter sp.]
MVQVNKNNYLINNKMKKIVLGYLLLVGGLLFSSCIKQNNLHSSMVALLKAGVGMRKDIGTAD